MEACVQPKCTWDHQHGKLAITTANTPLNQADLHVRYALPQDSHTSLPAQPGGSCELRRWEEDQRRSHCRPSAHTCTTHLPTCTTAPIWLRGVDKQMISVFSAVRFLSTIEKWSKKVFWALKTLLASLQSSLTPCHAWGYPWLLIMLTGSVWTK